VSAAAAIEFDHVSRWYGDTVALADVSFTVGPGVTGLLGHNGAGKSTALRLMGGFADTSSGSVSVLGLDPRRTPDAYRRIGIVPDHSPPWPFLTGREIVRLCARLRGVADPEAAAARALQLVDLLDEADRPVGGFSHGMRQRVKLAQALAHDPQVLLLDEPLNGLDPVHRRHVSDLLQELGEGGRTVIVSSHVLHEVERMAPRVLVLVNGRLVAEGATADIRALISDRPRRVRVVTGGDPTPLARDLVGEAVVSAVELDRDRLTVDTGDVERFSRLLPQVAQRTGTTLRRVEPEGDDLESVYAYLHDRARGVAR
jgi:ABC-2 type transport system ATP-binding protein